MKPSVVLKIPDGVDVSDGFHTFGELYEHRIALWIALCRTRGNAWRSWFHSDGSAFPGWFVLGLGEMPGEQMTYHLPASEWQACDFAIERSRAPDFDGHTAADVRSRLSLLR